MLLFERGRVSWRLGGKAGGQGKRRTDGIFLRGRQSQVALREALRVGLVLRNQILLDGSWCHVGWRDVEDWVSERRMG